VFASDSLVFWVESSGFELPVTLVLSGTVVTGYLCPLSRYRGAEKESLLRALRGGGFSVSAIIGGPTEEQQRRVAEEWEATPEEDKPEYFEQFAMRDVTIRAGAAPEWSHAHFLMVSARNVDAIHLGIEGKARPAEAEER